MKRILAVLTFAVLSCSMAVAQRLPEVARPENYKLTFTPDLEKATFEGDETIAIHVLKPTSEITLNAAELTLHEVSIVNGGAHQKARVTPEKEKEMVVLAVDKPLTEGPATVHITYSGILNDQMRGLYLGKDDQGRKYAATQFEATDARRAFPSFDEPDYKATFDITAVADKGMVAISNQKVVSDTPGPGDKHTVRFATTAKMSSYLAALIVGNFEYIEGEADGIPIRVYATPGKKDMGKFAVEAAEYILRYYDKYFAIKYPYGKLDLVGLPDFSAGAMENAGCITFREGILLIDEQHGSVDLKKGIASVIAHEMAHQWFGDLVTMKWWDDIWLNEGFATWMESKPVEAWKPEWNVNLDDVAGTGDALSVDSLSSTRPIHQAADTPDQIVELFDGIAYGKAASVLRMIEAYLGEEVFRAGVNAYLKQHQYANARAEDFWDAQAKTSGQPVDKIMPTWVRQAGAPIVDVKAQCSGKSTKVTLAQKRYYYDRSKFEETNDQLWQIPICLKGSATGDSAPKCELLTKREATFTLPGCSTWVLANAGASGYFREGFQPDAVRGLASDAESRLTPAERLAVEADIWASVGVGREPVGDYLAFAQGLQSDRNRAVIDEVVGGLGYVGQRLADDSDRDAYRAWLRQYLAAAMREVGWEAKAGESDEQKTLRSRLLGALGYDARDPEALAEAHKIADQALADPSSVDQDLAGRALRLAALEGNSEFYDKLIAAMKNPKSPEEYYIYFSALSQFSDPKLLERTLNYAISPDVRSQDALQLVAGVLSNPAGQKLAWDFIRQHWTEIEKVGGPFASAEVVGSTSVFCDAQLRDQVTEFFTAHKVEAFERTYKQSIERINNCVDFKAQQQSQLASWLGQHGTAGGK
ncbi:Peptidase M1, membrane alanine aminopeptidase [Candidatus Sulfotelmatobacter kueseliae]|uniref:Aminopeptidase n=1 Tax=Candidatus Sulfotelmatobacter kueseliae TaxID=2042962 RepID=A0A2U3KII0_9BACT|nr:Peptidase M1, membrane alanine aminopeptidase [Candidatus Sulfotelmatobacter kueseliae]